MKGLCRLGAGGTDSADDTLRVRITIMRLVTGELLALATNSRPKAALARYRQRWTIETMFRNLKTRGFDCEATHITNPAKLETLLVLMSIATTLAVKAGVGAERVRAIPVKKHGRKAISIFSLGLSVLRKVFARQLSNQVIAFLHAPGHPSV